MKDGDLFLLEVELSFPPDKLLGRSTHVLRSSEPSTWEVMERLQRYFTHHGVPCKVVKLGVVVAQKES